MEMMTSRISKFIDSPKARKSKYLENKTMYSLQIKQLIHYKFNVKISQQIVF